jgi:hypothetical protein
MGRKISPRVYHLINTSVDDMRSTLRCAENNGEKFPEEILADAFLVCLARREGTKVKILQAQLRKDYPKDGGHHA